MRYIPIRELNAGFFAEPAGAKSRAQLFRGHKTLAKMQPEKRQAYARRNGPRKWSPIKRWLTHRLGQKCWYTEVELVGAPLAIDHFRPVRDYWWLAFEAANYRVSCAFANSPQHNPLHGCSGGKGDEFPLLGRGLRARGRNSLRWESPLLLDPCNETDCDLVAFQSDGRPVLNPAYAADPIARVRVEESKILLNLDHPDFNSKREQLCREIGYDVKTHEELAEDAGSRIVIRERIAARLTPDAPFSSASRYYLRLHRDHEWVEAILQGGGPISADPSSPAVATATGL